MSNTRAKPQTSVTSGDEEHISVSFFPFFGRIRMMPSTALGKDS